MTDNKTGAFIASLRKEKGLTQVQLAEKLNVTDKAISRWETGKGLPEASLLISLASTLGITVNELLTGEKISEETFSQKSDNNLVNAVQRTEKAVKQGKLTKLFLIIAVIVCVLSISLLVKNAIESENTVTYTGTFDTKNRIAVMKMLLDSNEQTHFFTENTVCTDYQIELDSDGNIIKAEFTMNDEFKHEYINIVLFSPSEQPNQISYRILRQRDYISSEDGILFMDLCVFLINADIAEESKKHSDIEDFDTIFIGGQSTLYFNFDGQRNISFEGQLLFDGELKKVSNASGMYGKYYEIVISTFNKTTSTDGRCFSVYVER